MQKESSAASTWANESSKAGLEVPKLLKTARIFWNTNEPNKERDRFVLAFIAWTNNARVGGMKAPSEEEVRRKLQKCRQTAGRTAIF